MYLPEVIERVLCMYLAGMSIHDISDYVGLSPREINQILDAYTPFL